MTRTEAERLRKLRTLLRVSEQRLADAVFLLIDIVETAEREHQQEDRSNDQKAYAAKVFR